jgi:hypothetical protein
MASRMIKSLTQIETDLKKQLHNDLYDYLVCQRCQIVPKTGEIYVCALGEHAMCADCFISTKVCPICFTKNARPSKGLEQLRNKLPMSCKYRKNGCTTVLTLDSMLYHEPECQLRLIFCPDLNCGAKELFQELGLHLKYSHPCVVERKLSLFYTCYIVHEDTYYMETETYNPIQFSLKKAQFFLQMFVNNGLFYFWVHYHGSPEEAKNYKCTIKVFKDGADEKFIYTSTVRSLDEPLETIINDENALIISTRQIRRLVANGKLKCIVKVSCPKEEEIDKAKTEDVDSDLSD